MEAKAHSFLPSPWTRETCHEQNTLASRLWVQETDLHGPHFTLPAPQSCLDMRGKLTSANAHLKRTRASKSQANGLCVQIAQGNPGSEENHDQPLAIPHTAQIISTQPYEQSP